MVIVRFTIDSIGEKRFVQNVHEGLKVTLNGVMYDKNIISKIEIFKFMGSNDNNIAPCIFVYLFMGNINLATWIIKDVVLDEDRYLPEDNEKDGKLYGYCIRLPHDWEK
jgi:hypothetical protein